MGLGGLRPKRLILWGGGFPPDLDPGTFAANRPGLDLKLVVGDRDGWINAEKRDAEVERLRVAGLTPGLETFAGGHRLDESILSDLGAM